MKIYIFFFLFVARCAFIPAAFARKLSTPEVKLMGGQEAKPHSHPYLVSLQSRFFWIRQHICGGVLLNENWILSAGHCIVQSWLIRWLPMDAVVGTHDVDYFSDSAQIIAIRKRIAHPKYSGGIGPYDIGMLKTAYPFIFTNEVQPINLPHDYYYGHKDALILAGWGALQTSSFLPNLPSKLQEVEVTYIPYDECYKALDDVKDVGEDVKLDNLAHICTGPLSGGVAACSGDSGGPLIQYIPYYIDEPNIGFEEATEHDYNIESEDSTRSEERSVDAIEIERHDVNDSIPVVLGIVSWGISPCGVKGAPTVYTNVTNYLDFIYQHIYD